MLRYLNKMGAIHWLLLAIAVFALMSLGKLLAVVMILVAGIACLVRFWGGIVKTFNKLFKEENK